MTVANELNKAISTVLTNPDKISVIRWNDEPAAVLVNYREFMDMCAKLGVSYDHHGSRRSA